MIRDLQKIYITVQGGIGTSEEDKFLRTRYGADGTGWATPFLLAEDVVNVDCLMLEQLSKANENDIYLSGSSPMGVPFWNLRSSASEKSRLKRINEGKPGSPCPKQFIALNTEFTIHPVCVASRAYQQKMLEALENSDLPAAELQRLRKRILEKSCICHDLGGSVKIKNDIEPDATPAVCSGPNIAFFGKITNLEEMVGHIYGRLSLLSDKNRAHMFIQELKIYLDYLKNGLAGAAPDSAERSPRYWEEFKNNLLDGIRYYKALADEFMGEQRIRFANDLELILLTYKTILV